MCVASGELVNISPKQHQQMSLKSVTCGTVSCALKHAFTQLFRALPGARGLCTTHTPRVAVVGTTGYCHHQSQS